MRRASGSVLGGIALLMVAAGALWLAREPLAQLCVERARRLDTEQEAEAAARYARFALRLDPSSIEARLLHARLLQLEGAFEASQGVLATVDESLLSDSQRLAGLTTWAVNALRMSRLDDAGDRFAEALELAQALDRREDELAIHVHLGRMSFYYTHDYERSQGHLEHALRLAAETGLEGPGAEATALLGQLLWWWKQEVSDPLPRYFEPALAVFQRLGDRYNEADTLHKIAFFHANDGNLLEFFKFQDKSLALRDELGDRAGLAHEYLTLGWAYLRLNDYRRAQRYLEKSLEVNADRGDLFTYLQSQRVLADCEMRQGFVDRAEDRLRRALERENGETAPEDPFLWAALGEVVQRRGRPLEARRYFRRALETGERGDIGGANRVWMLAGLSRSFISTGALDRAAEVIAEMAAAVDGMNHWGSVRRLELERAALAEARGDRRAAFRALLEAEELQLRSVASAPIASDTTDATHERLLAMLLSTALDPALPRLIEGSGEAHARLAFELLEQRSYGFFRDLVVLSVGRRRRATDDVETALARLRTASRGTEDRLSGDSVTALRDAYGRYEDVLLRRALSDRQYDEMRRARPPGLAAVRARLDDETALLRYVLAAGRVYCLVIRKDELRAVALPIERRELPPKVRLFRTLALDPGDREADAWRPVAGALFRALFEPVRESGLLEGIHRIGVVPYGELHDVPYAALHDPDRDRHLIEDYEIFLLPTASSLVAEPPREPARDGVLSLGIRDAAGLAPLSFAPEEARIAVDALGGRALLEGEATETALKSSGGGYRYLHLATHGVSEPRMPLLSHLVLRASTRDDGRLTVGETFGLDFHAELVVLAGCRTGLSFSPEGGRRGPVGRFGLIQAFLHSGAGSVLASLAPVSDAGTLTFMRAFYERLPHSSPSSALAGVQRAMAAGTLQPAGAEGSSTHPRYWASFILVSARG